MEGCVKYRWPTRRTLKARLIVQFNQMIEILNFNGLKFLEEMPKTYSQLFREFSDGTKLDSTGGYTQKSMCSRNS